jgi:hypothetical protein
VWGVGLVQVADAWTMPEFSELPSIVGVVGCFALRFPFFGDGSSSTDYRRSPGLSRQVGDGWNMS